MIILGYHYVTILLAKMLIWATFSQLMCTFNFCINPCLPNIFFPKFLVPLFWRNIYAIQLFFLVFLIELTYSFAKSSTTWWIPVPIGKNQILSPGTFSHKNVELSKIWVPIFVHPKAVTDLKKGLYSLLVASKVISLFFVMTLDPTMVYVKFINASIWFSIWISVISFNDFVLWSANWCKMIELFKFYTFFFLYTGQACFLWVVPQ